MESAALQLPQSMSPYPARSPIKRQKMIYFLKFGEFGVNEGQFTEPAGVAVNNIRGEIIVADTNGHRVQVFSRDGEFKLEFGGCGKRDGQLLYPNRIAVNQTTGNLFITERSPTHQIQIFDAYGNFIRKFGSNILQHPRGVCVDHQGRVVVVECKVMRVIIFDSAGNVLSKFDCGRHLEFPNAVCTSPDEEILISDNRAHCIKVFNYEGFYLRQIGGEGLTNYPIGVAVDKNGSIIVADNHNNFNLTIFDKQGRVLNALESKVKHAQCYDMAVLDDGTIAVSSKDYRIYLYRYGIFHSESERKPVIPYDSPIKDDMLVVSSNVHLATEPIKIEKPTIPSVADSSSNGNMPMSELTNYFSQTNLNTSANSVSSGSLQNICSVCKCRLANSNTSTSLQILPDLNTSTNSNIFQFAPEMGSGSIQIPQSMGPYPSRSPLKRQKMIYFLKFGEFGVNEGQFTEPAGIAVNNVRQEIVIADTNGHRVQVFSRDGEFKLEFGGCGKRDGQLLYPNRVAVNQVTGNLFITERSPTHQIQIFDFHGNFIRKFGSNVLQHPRGICVDHKGRVIVVECKVMRVIIFDSFGNVISKFNCGRHLEFPNAVCTSPDEEILISDNRAHCIKVFNYEGFYLRQIGGEGLTNYPIGVAVDKNGSIIVADNHNNFNLTIFDKRGRVLNALESKIKHAQCYDMAVLSDGTIAVSSKDYRVYLYRYGMSQNENQFPTPQYDEEDLWD